MHKISLSARPLDRARRWSTHGHTRVVRGVRREFEHRVRFPRRRYQRVSPALSLTGGGASTPSGFVHAGGGFSCTSPVNGPTHRLPDGEGVRWDTAALKPTRSSCTAAESLRPATTGDDTVVLTADFYRAGDANDESFTANMIVTTQDLDGGIPGVQNVWVQGVGCGTANVNFSA